ncbi:hypothetical protein KCP75_04670 [Salmonella enterica subsp. enterica]|nr:hypothetical protein KCP75_04670 [Salmonella enterica subsp. enterica]
MLADSLAINSEFRAGARVCGGYLISGAGGIDLIRRKLTTL